MQAIEKSKDLLFFFMTVHLYTAAVVAITTLALALVVLGAAAITTATPVSMAFGVVVVVLHMFGFLLNYYHMEKLVMHHRKAKV